jgi:predicted anti-sigma-YlaC factor YlaD
MHAVIKESLEEYLAGALEPVDQRRVEAHLSGCEICRQAVRKFADVSSLFGVLRSEEPVSPPLGFYSQVLRRVEERKAAPSFTSLFALDLAFGRRLVFSSLMTLAVLGCYLATRESTYPAGPSPDAVMAEQTLPAFETAPGHDSMLVTLAVYER